MAIRMVEFLLQFMHSTHSSSFQAQDLGIDRDEDTWKRFGVDAFSSLEKEARKQLWHACSFADRQVLVQEGVYYYL